MHGTFKTTSRLIPCALFLLCAFLLCSNPTTSSASGGIDPKDPMVRITYVPIKQNVGEVLATVSRQVTSATGVAEKYITYYWQTFDAIHCMGKKATDRPIFVDLYVPGFFTDKQVGEMMTAIADALHDTLGIEKKWVFIHTHFPQQGQVYISGKVEHWDNYRGRETPFPPESTESVTPAAPAETSD